MSRFLTTLIIEDTNRQQDGRELFRLDEPLDYELGHAGSGYVITVPAGFYTDFASVPRFFWRLLPPWGEHGRAAVLHDWLYQPESGFTKVVSDAIFYEAMRVSGVSWWKRCVMLAAVVVFGRGANP